MPKKHASRLEKEAREEFIILLMTRGYTNTQIHQALKDKYGVEERQRYRDIAQARKTMAGFGSQATAQERGLFLKRVDLVFQQAVTQKDLAAAAKILQIQSHTLSKGEIVHVSSPTSSGYSAELAEALRALERQTLVPSNGS
jgi:hypothetical protein